MLLGEIATLDCDRSGRALCHASWMHNGLLSFLVFDYLDYGSNFLSLVEDKVSFCTQEHVHHPAGNFIILSTSDISRIQKILGVPSQIRRTPIFSNSLTLHTSLDRIDDPDLFKKWLSHYRMLGADGISICINGGADKSGLAKYTYNAASEIFSNVLVYQCSLPWRYRPSEIEPGKTKQYHLASPGQFHHVQHIMMHLSTYILDSDLFLFADVDEFLMLESREYTIASIMENSDASYGYWENNWHYYIPDNLYKTDVRLALDLESHSSFPNRSKYCIKRGAATYLNIHEPLFESRSHKGIRLGEIVHLANLSSYSKRPHSLIKCKEALGLAGTVKMEFREL